MHSIDPPSLLLPSNCAHSVHSLLNPCDGVRGAPATGLIRCRNFTVSVAAAGMCMALTTSPCPAATPSGARSTAAPPPPPGLLAADPVSNDAPTVHLPQGDASLTARCSSWCSSAAVVACEFRHKVHHVALPSTVHAHRPATHPSPACAPEMELAAAVGTREGYAGLGPSVVESSEGAS
jgi:hypothetical protein